jgi:hypothetical protein
LISEIKDIDVGNIEMKGVWLFQKDGKLDMTFKLGADDIKTISTATFKKNQLILVGEKTTEILTKVE